MGVPATTGKRCTNLADMEIGDYIACKYYAPSANAAGVFSDFGGSGTELPIMPGTTANGYFYFLKVAKGLCVADRMVQQQISWTALNNGGYIYGNETEHGLIRMLSESEYIKYLMNSNLDGNITVQNEAVWHKPIQKTYTNYENSYGNRDTPEIIQYTYFCEHLQNSSGIYTFPRFNINGAQYSSSVLVRGRVKNKVSSGDPEGIAELSKNIDKSLSSVLSKAYSSHWGSASWISYIWIYLNLYCCFRPVFEFNDNKKSTNIWY